MAETKIYRVSLKEGAGPRVRMNLQSGMVAVFDNRSDPKLMKGARAEYFLRMTDLEYAEKMLEGVYNIAPATEQEAEAGKTAHQKAYAKPAGSQKPSKGKMPTEPGGVSEVQPDPSDVVNPEKAALAAKKL